MNIKSLLENLKPNQVNDLIIEHTLKYRHGYQFYYTLDNHDIYRYCFPLNIDGKGYDDAIKTQTINYSLETDYITAYEDFFNGISKDRPVFFLDEYRYECDSLRKIIVGMIQSNSTFNYYDKFSKYYESNKDNNVKHDFTFFIALVSGALKDAATRFNSIVENDFFIRDEDDKAEIDHLADFKELFFNAYVDGYDLTRTLKKIFPKSKRDDSSSSIDCQAIARVLSVNKRLISNPQLVNKPTLFLFLSTTKSAYQLFNDEKVNILLPKISTDEGLLTINFHRNAAQLFLNRLIKHLSPEDKLNRLKSAEKFLSYREKYQTIIAEYRSQENENINKDSPDNDTQLLEISKTYEILEEKELTEFQYLLEGYVEINFQREEQMKEIEEYYKKFRDLFERKGYKALDKFYTELKSKYNANPKDYSYVNTIEIKEKELTIHYEFATAFKISLGLLRTETLVLRRGGDEITGTGQHMPIVFTFSDPSRTLDQTAEYFLEKYLITTEEELRHSVVNGLKEMATSYHASAETKSLEDKLAFCLYLLVLPELEGRTGKNTKIVIRFLKAHLELEELKLNEQLYSDYWYVLVWLLRRDGKREKYAEALRLTNEAINHFKDDARFYHSRFLITACLLKGNAPGDDGAIKTKLNSLIADIQQTKKLYPAILSYKSKVIQTNIEATLTNSDIYANLLLINATRPFGPDVAEKLNDIRMNQLVLLKNTMGDKYNKYPEFLHTEAYLESLESETKTTIADRIHKLNHAIKAINASIESALTLPGFDVDEFSLFRTEMIARKYKLVELGKKGFIP